MTMTVETLDLRKSFAGSPVLENVNLHVPAGTVLGLAGANGAGKTTLLLLIAGYYWPSAGEVRLFGQTLPREASGLRQRLHFVSAESNFMPSFRIAELLHYFDLLYDRFEREKANQLFKALDLPLQARLGQLSLGTVTQVRLALALACRPDILLMDEPTNGLDPVVRHQFLQFIVDQTAASGTTVLMATHHLEPLETMADSVAFLYKGRVLMDARVDVLKGEVREVQAVLSTNLPSEILHSPQVMTYERRGSVHVLVTDGQPRELMERLWSAGAEHVEAVTLSLEEIFRRLMEREGYVRHALHND